jgi:hypothetical protein
MAAPLKTVGLRELEALRKRTRRQLAMERIAPSDAEYIIHRLDEVEVRIIQMREEGEDYGD